MKKIITIIAFGLYLIYLFPLSAQPYSIQPVPFSLVKIKDRFWSAILENHAKVTLNTCIAQTQDSTKRINNFEKAAGLAEGKHEGIIERVWEDVVYRNMYITGGIGSSGLNENFSEDYHFPNKTAYCETCASIGMVFWNNRMNMLTKEGKYADILERSLYNGVLPGVSFDGDLFFYVNPLESAGDHHRQRWYGTTCCPSNIARFIPSAGNYIYLTGKDELYVNLFMGNETDVRLSETKVNLVQKTNYPWDGKVLLQINPVSPVLFTVKMRIPGWCKNFKIAVNKQQIAVPLMADGYVMISREWKAGDNIRLELYMPVELVAADPRVSENIGKRAVQRGPLVYCLEETDNKNLNFDAVFLDKQSTYRIARGKGKLQDMTVFRTKSGSQNLMFIPYFAWDNREPGKMKVWIDYRE